MEGNLSEQLNGGFVLGGFFQNLGRGEPQKFLDVSVHSEMLLNGRQESLLEIILSVFYRVSLRAVVDFQTLSKPKFFVRNYQHTKIPYRDGSMLPILKVHGMSILRARVESRFHFRRHVTIPILGPEVLAATNPPTPGQYIPNVKLLHYVWGNI